VTRLIYALVALASVVAVALTVRLIQRHAVVPAPVTVPIAPPCAELGTTPGPVLPAASAAPLTVLAPDVTLRIDGAPAGTTVSEGLHLIEAVAPGATPTSLQVRVSPFVPVVLDARVTAGAVTLLMVGARCETCVHTDTELRLDYQRGGIGDVRGVARALSLGDWVLAAQQVRTIAPDDRKSPELVRLVAVLCALAGRPSLVHEQVSALPKQDPLVKALAQREKEEALVPQRQLATATARWNATSDRFQRLTDRFVADAPELLTELTKRFGALSEQFTQAQHDGDALACEATLELATTALRDAVKALRALHRDDCAFQRRITAAL